MHSFNLGNSKFPKYLTLAELTLLLGSFATVFIPGVKPLALLLAILAILLLAIGLIYAFSQYRKQPAWKEKKSLEGQSAQLDKQVAAANLDLEKVNNQERAITAEEERRIAALKASIDATRTPLAAQRDQLVQRRSTELKHEQDQFYHRTISAKLRQVELVSATIPGFGPKNKQILAAHRIVTANDIDYNRILAISGMGEAKAQALVDFKKRVIDSILFAGPIILPKEDSDRIWAKFQSQITQLDSQIRQLDEKFNHDRAVISNKAAQAKAPIQAKMVPINNRLAELKAQLSGLNNQLDGYREITFSNFARRLFPVFGKQLKARHFVGLVGAAGIFQAALAFGSSVGIIIENLPTRTPTPTATSTATGTITFTPINTFTLTPSFTASLTPTITNTPTFTLTPTWTIRPTDTRWPTAAPGSRSGSIGGVCDCSRDYDCPDFASHSEAQACFVSCGGSASFNWSRLDRDRDGLACE